MPHHDDDAYCKHRVFPAVTCELCYPKPTMTDKETSEKIEEKPKKSPVEPGQVGE
jgi:hypothetical protein